MTQHSNNKLLRIISHFHLKGLDWTQPSLCGGRGGNSQCAANLVSRVSLSDLRCLLSVSAGRTHCAGAHVLVGRGCQRAVLTLAIAVGLLGLDLIAPVFIWNRERKNVNPGRACELSTQPRGPEPGKKPWCENLGGDGRLLECGTEVPQGGRLNDQRKGCDWNGL